MATKNDTSLVKYGSYDIEEAEQDAKELSEGKDRVFVKLGVGKTRVRFIPPLPDRKWKRVTFVHYIDVPGVGRRSFTCPRMEAKQPCPSCKTAQKLAASDNALDQERAKKLQPKRRCLANVILRSQAEDGPKILAFGPQIENQLVEMRKDLDLGGNFIDPVEGFDILIMRTGTGQNDTEYKVVAADKGKSCALHDDVVQMNEWIKNQHNLENRVKLYNVEDIQRILRGEKPLGEDSNDEDGGGAAPVTRGKDKAGKTTKTSRLSDEFDDEEEDDEDEE